MAKVRLSKRATRDLDAIFDQTELKWGFEQAEFYVSKIKFACQSLSNHPRPGRSANDVRAAYFVIKSGSHNIFFRAENGHIFVARILHERMDSNRHI